MFEIEFDFLFRCQLSKVRSEHGEFQRLDVHLPQERVFTTYHNGSETLSWPVLMTMAADRLNHVQEVDRLLEAS